MFKRYVGMCMFLTYISTGLSVFFNGKPSIETTSSSLIPSGDVTVYFLETLLSASFSATSAYRGACFNDKLICKHTNHVSWCFMHFIDRRILFQAKTGRSALSPNVRVVVFAPQRSTCTAHARKRSCVHAGALQVRAP